MRRRINGKRRVALTSWQGAAGSKQPPMPGGGIWPISKSETVTTKNPPNPPFKKGGYETYKHFIFPLC